MYVTTNMIVIVDCPIIKMGTFIRHSISISPVILFSFQTMAWVLPGKRFKERWREKFKCLPNSGSIHFLSICLMNIVSLKMIFVLAK